MQQNLNQRNLKLPLYLYSPKHFDEPKMEYLHLSIKTNICSNQHGRNGHIS